MSRYAIIDVANLFYRARHVVQGDAYTKAGMALHIVFRSLRKLHREFKVDHMVFCMEGKSWRFDVYPLYKAKRRLARKQATPQEQEEEAVFNSVMDDFADYIATKTRCTVLQSQGVEGDDFVARWIQLHPNDEHFLLSGDSDFVQLIADNVSIYNGVDDRLLTTKGVFDGDGNELVFSLKPDSGKVKVHGTFAECKAKHDKEQKEKNKEHIASEKLAAVAHTQAEQEKKKADPDYKVRHYVAKPYDVTEFHWEMEPEWWRKALFIKLIRGDTGDGITSAYPGVRYNGSSKKAGIAEAWEDRKDRGFIWNNFMLTEWKKIDGFDENGEPNKVNTRVIDEYRLNESLIDLTQQPERVKNLMDEVIVQAVQKEPVSAVGVHFLKYCGKYELNNLAKEAKDHSAYLNAPYQS